MDAYKLGIIDEKGNRIMQKKAKKPEVELVTSEQKNSYTILHKLVFNIKKIFAKVPGLRTKVGTYAAALFLLKDTFKEHVEDPDMFEKEFVKFLHENEVELDNTISEDVAGFGEVLPKGEYVLINDILNKEEEELSAKKGDKDYPKTLKVEGSLAQAKRNIGRDPKKKTCWKGYRAQGTKMKGGKSVPNCVPA